MTGRLLGASAEVVGNDSTASAQNVLSDDGLELRYRAANQRARYRCLQEAESVATPNLCLQFPHICRPCGNHVRSVALCAVFTREAAQPVLSLSPWRDAATIPARG